MVDVDIICHSTLDLAESCRNVLGSIYMNCHLVSIIIPVYNTESYLAECIDSVLRQTYKNIEIILVDDGSPDRCPQICDEYVKRDSRIKVIHKSNGGASEARNVGFAASNGKYIYFMDSDDYICNNAIEELYFFAEKENADFVFFSAITVLKNNKKQKNAPHYGHENMYNTDTGVKILKQLLKKNEYNASVPLTFICAEFIRKQGLEFYEGIIIEDELYKFKMFLYAAKVAHLNKVLYFRRINPISVMSAKISVKNFNGLLTVFYELLKIYKNPFSSPEIRELTRNRMITFFSWLVFVYKALPLNERKIVKWDKKNLIKNTKQEHCFKSPRLRIACTSFFLYSCMKRIYIMISSLKKIRIHFRRGEK